jgi:predicted Rossmann fold nucleotide-binding protein DprA/Smf involved in DNA uptake
MKKLADDLKFVNKEINALSKKLEQLSKKAVKLMKAAVGNKVKSKAAPKKKAVKKSKVAPVKAAPAKKTVKKKVVKKATTPKKTVVKKAVKTAAKKPVGKPSATPTNKILSLMKRYKKGIAISKLKERSGLNDKQISNILHRASKEGKIKRVARGVYQLV